ncbi:MAG: hypothetical protein KatS3mg091_265 [Patescibacteria group bacterium]|nr:MAG: hypothetical protein KatS3mg091_265 [Patescibacteria group bacterium]
MTFLLVDQELIMQDKWSDFRWASWLGILEFPDLILKSTKQLLVFA